MDRDDEQLVVVERAGLNADGTRLALHDGRVIQLRTLPDPDGPRRVQRVLRRITRVDVHLGTGQITATVSGVGHRRACELPVSLGTALALTLEGIPTAVTIDDAIGSVAPLGASA